MELDKTITFFDKRILETNSESEKKAIQRFIVVLNDLKGKDLSDEKLESIEQQIANLSLEAKVKHKGSYLNQRLSDFERYLQRQFKFRPVNYHRSFGIILGLSFGVALGFSLGSLFDGMLGLILSLIFTISIGGTVGRVLGTNKDLQFEREGRLYENR